MRETWLQTNRRALWIGTVPPLVFMALGTWLAWGFTSPGADWPRWLGTTMIIVGGALVATLLAQLHRPRIVYDDGQVLFHLRNGPPIAVPVELVEAFFLGQGPLMLPGPPKQGDATVNLVARISQRDPTYAEREVKPALGRWSESYITIRGTWCEPLDGELIRRVNHRLREATEERASRTSAG
jgi:hypothetical protein